MADASETIREARKRVWARQRRREIACPEHWLEESAPITREAYELAYFLVTPPINDTKH
jgi:hypothetical protein